LGNPDPQAAAAGPHAPQGPLLLGTAGWWPPNQPWNQIVGSHGNPAVNPGLCAGCHVVPFDVTDAATGDFIVEATGHLFAPIPCLDEEGRPIARGNCSDSQRTFVACATSGCHSDEDAARSAKAGAEARIAQLRGALGSLLDQVPDAEFDQSDQVYTTAEGAEFNRKLARGGAHVHNPLLTETLLIASIEAVRAQYGVTQQSPVSLTPALEPGGTQ
jgi:hypothetical protein